VNAIFHIHPLSLARHLSHVDNVDKKYMIVYGVIVLQAVVLTLRQVAYKLN
jgi:hypothetical protein